MSGIGQLRKVWRFILIYGPARATVKVLGRVRLRIRLPFAGRSRDTAIIGCGQYAFSTIGYFVWRGFGNRFSRCFDIDEGASSSFADFYGAIPVSQSDEIFADASITHIFIASNHASHADYAIQALTAGKACYVEKPIAVSYDQLSRLRNAVELHPNRLYCGFNRPYSYACRLLRKHFPKTLDTYVPITLACFITGHKIPPDHWYRRSGEGTRVCGNLAHWLDLMVHILSWHQLPDRWRISVCWSDVDNRDDNVSIVLTSAMGDLVSIVLSAREEPFEGINETINVQAGSLIAKIDDFRRIEIWNGEVHKLARVWPKDVGHRGAISQIYAGSGRSWDEVEASSLLTLHIKEMVEAGVSNSDFSFEDARHRLICQ
jgi:predicted dehydrogenase